MLVSLALPNKHNSWTAWWKVYQVIELVLFPTIGRHLIVYRLLIIGEDAGVCEVD